MALKDMIINGLILLLNIISIYLLVKTITTNENDYKKNKILLLVNQIILGIISLYLFVFIYQHNLDMFGEIIAALPLIINTVSIVLFLVLKNNIRINKKYKFSILSIIAIICGLITTLVNLNTIRIHILCNYNKSVQEIMYNNYNQKEAKEFYENINEALDLEGFDLKCLNINSMWKDRDHNDRYRVNLFDDCKSEFLPANQLVVVPNNENKTKIDRIYWQFNDDVEIDYYKDGKQVDEFKYIYVSSLYKDELRSELKSKFENEVKEDLKSPSSAIFTYNNFTYNTNTKRFTIEGWVEGQNSFGAMVKQKFKLNLKPCNDKGCNYYHLDYDFIYYN